MNLQSEKLEVAKMVLDTNNKSILMRIKNIFETEKIDLWDEIPSQVTKDVDEAFLQANSGFGKPHNEVMKKYKKWLIK
jgi:hypothetical protein